MSAGLAASTWIASRLAARRADQTPPAAPAAIGRRQAVLIGVIMWSGYLLVLWALSLAPLSVVSPVRETSVVGVAGCGVWGVRQRAARHLKLAAAVGTPRRGGAASLLTFFTSPPRL